MRCSRAGKYLSLYIDGELEVHDRVLLESHIVKCCMCARKIEELTRVHSLFADAERFSAPQGFSAEVMAKVSAQPSRGLALIPFFVRFAEVTSVVLAITVGIMSGSILTNALALHHRGEAVVASLSLETFEALPPDSLGRAYISMTEETQ
jgi:anti-sigma factor RsiW